MNGLRQKRACGARPVPVGLCPKPRSIIPKMKGGAMPGDPYDDRGNKDRSIANPHGAGSLKPAPGTGHPMDTAQAFLIGEAMTGGYGKGPDILHDCTIAVDRGEIAVIVGPNGAGKSTAMKARVRDAQPALGRGAARRRGHHRRSAPQDRVVKGMGFVPQTYNIFTSLTVEENLEMGAFIRTRRIPRHDGAGL